MASGSPAAARLRGELRALDGAYSSGHHGRWSAARRAELVDACLRGLFEAEGRPGVALVALGGYGRRELAPFSDVDLLILHATDDDPDALQGLAERLLYPLWDAGLAVGHGVRTEGGSLTLAAQRLDALTSMLDGRLVAGEVARWDRLHGRVLSSITERPREFADQLRANAAERRDRFGDVSSLLEPDVKEGAGGLRDLHALGWLAAAVGPPQADQLKAAGPIRRAEREAVEAAEEFLVRVRSALHLETGRRTDRLYLEQQPSIARAMGFEDEPGLPAVDGLMRALFEHARQVEHVSRAVFDRLLRGESPGVDVDATPQAVMGAFATVAGEHGVMAPSTLDRIEQIELSQQVEWSDGVREAFLDLLRAGTEGGRALEALDRAGLLTQFLPEWEPVRCRPQRDPYHRHSVDVHLLHTLEGMSALLDGSGGEDDPMAVQAAASIDDRDAVLLAALLHDIGKTGDGSHVPAGVTAARSALDRIGLPGPSRDLTLFLVSEHLLLSDTATRRDLQDDDLVVDVAARVGDPERLAALYLLTVADAQATGPLAWTPWRAALVRELVAKVQRVLERGEVGPRTAERLEERSGRVRELLSREDPAAVDRFLRSVPRGYLLAISPEQIASQFALLRAPVGAREVRTMSGAGTKRGTYALTVVAADRPGLLSLIAGALSLAGLSIMSAQVFTTEDGLAIDVFEVEGAFEAQIGEERWREFRTTLRRAIEGRLSLEYRVEQKRAHYATPPAEVPVEVRVHNDASDFFTVIEVGAPDRIGLLFDITRTFAELHLDVHLAKVATYGRRVVDAFYVRDTLGRKVEDPGQIAEIQRAVAARAAA
jgi:[protein-PII] uridylyltransferase